MDFRSLEPKNLPAGFDLEKQTERPIVNVKEEDGTITVDFIFPGFHLTNETLKVQGKAIEFKRVTINSTGFLFDKGKPMLPSFGCYLQIPRNCAYEITAEPTSESREFKVLVSPAQTERKKPERISVTEYHKKTYSQDIIYPGSKKFVSVSDPFWIEGYRALLIHVCPFRYNPKEQRLIGFGNIRVTVRFKHRIDDKPDFSTRAAEPKAVDRLFLNPGDLHKRLGLPPIAKKRFVGPEFLIIYHDSLNTSTSVQDLVDWKRSKGLITKMISISQFSNVGSLKQYLRGRMMLPSRLRYVLLLGDSNLIQAEHVLGYATDHYLSTTDGPIPQSPNVFFPHLSIGRIPAKTQDEADKIIKKIIDYEKNPPPIGPFYQKVTLAVEPAIVDPTCDDIEGETRVSAMDRIRQHLSSRYCVEWVCDKSPAATDIIVNAANEGRLFIVHRGHGSENGWWRPSFTKQDLPRVTGQVPSILYNANCRTGNYDAAVDCFSEADIKNCPTPSTISATSLSNEILNNFFTEGIVDAIFQDYLPNYSGNPNSQVKNCRLGDVLKYAKFYVASVPSSENSFSAARYINSFFEMYHVLGDPTLELWTAFPIPIGMEATILTSRLRIRLSIRPPKGCVVTIWFINKVTGKKNLLKRITPSTQQFEVPIPIRWHRSFSMDIYDLFACCWAPGHGFSETPVRTNQLPCG